MAKIDEEFACLSRNILLKGRWYEDPNREGVQRLQIPHYKFEHDLQKDGFPALTTKKLYWKGVVGELLWFLQGRSDIHYLLKNNIHIWDKDGYKFYEKCYKKYPLGKDKMSLEEWSTKNTEKQTNYSGDLGRIYGLQWKKWTNYNYEKNIFEDSYSIQNKPIDQINRLIRGLINNPLGTSHIVTAWNPAELDQMALPPCHKGFQIMVYPLDYREKWALLIKDGYTKSISDSDLVTEECIKRGLPIYGFDLVWEQRSVDTFLGLPFNIASYALLAHIIGKITNMVPYKIIGDLRNVHFYDNSLEAVRELMDRDVEKYPACTLEIEDRPEYERLKLDRCSLDNFMSNLDISDFKLKGYESYDALKVEMLNRDK